MSRVGAEGELQEQQPARQTRPTNKQRRIAVITVCVLVVIAAAIVLLVVFIPGQANSNEGGELGLVCVASQVYEKLSDLRWYSGVAQFIPLIMAMLKSWKSHLGNLAFHPPTT